jgi:hypothetical protein
LKDDGNAVSERPEIRAHKDQFSQFAFEVSHPPGGSAGPKHVPLAPLPPEPPAMQAGSLLTLNFYPCDSGATACTNNNGNIWREKVASPGMSGTATQEYRYDGLNRLAVAAENASGSVTATSTCSYVGGNWCQQFGYDVYGNRWVNTYSGVAPATNTPLSASNFDASNHITVNSAQPDARGNLQQIGGANGQTFAYDAENRIVTVSSGSTTIAGIARSLQPAARPLLRSRAFSLRQAEENFIIHTPERFR